jgi:hypothetical protein
MKFLNSIDNWDVLFFMLGIISGLLFSIRSKMK